MITCTAQAEQKILCWQLLLWKEKYRAPVLDTKTPLLFCQKKVSYVLLLLNNSIKEIQTLEDYEDAMPMRSSPVRRTEIKSLYIVISVDSALKPP